MKNNCLESFIEGVRRTWGLPSMVAGCRQHLEELLNAPETEPWLAALHRNRPSSQELYRDLEHGFMLLAHVEAAELYRPPHDHGRAWVIYAIQQGEIEMGTYSRSVGPDGTVQLVKKDSTRLRPGQSKVFLPGDIHDTRCITGPALLFRFTERDLKKEDKEEHQVMRYVERAGVWSEGAA